MKNDQQQQLILHEPLVKVMWKLSLPAIAAMVLYGLNAFMDTVYIGQLLNETALAGVALAYPLTGIMMGIGAWAGTGAGNLLSIAIGDNDEDTQRKLLPNTTLFAGISTVVFIVPAYFFAEPLIQMMGGSGELLQEGTEYFKITLLGAPAWVYGLMLNFVIRGEGRMKKAAIMMVYGLVVNLILTPVFIQSFGMGVEGAAWATNIGMLIYSIVGYIYFQRGKASFPGIVSRLSYNQPLFGAIIKNGFPGFILTIMGLVQAVVVFHAIVGVGTERDLAFFAASNRIMLFLMTPLFGLMRALQPVLGINFGAQQYDRVKKGFILFTKTGFYIMMPFWAVLMVFPEYSLHLMVPDMSFEPGDMVNFRIYMLVLPVLPLVFMAITFFPAIKEEKYATIIGMARQLVFYVPIMLLLPRFFGLEWVYYGATLIDITLTVWILVVVIQLFKKLSRYEKEGAPKELSAVES